MVAKAGLKLTEDDPELLIPLTSCPECRDHKHVPPHCVDAVLGLEPLISVN